MRWTLTLRDCKRNKICLQNIHHFAKSAVTVHKTRTCQHYCLVEPAGLHNWTILCHLVFMPVRLKFTFIRATDYYIDWLVSVIWRYFSLYCCSIKSCFGFCLFLLSLSHWGFLLKSSDLSCYSMKNSLLLSWHNEHDARKKSSNHCGLCCIDFM